MTVAACLKRQALGLKWGSDGGNPFFEFCNGCVQGAEHARREKGMIMTESIQAVDSDAPKPVEWAACRECGGRAIRPNAALCARCMAKKGNAKKAEAGAVPIPAGIPRKPDPETAADAGRSLHLQFDQWPDILEGVKRLADIEVRPVHHQVIYMLKAYIEDYGKAISG